MRPDLDRYPRIVFFTGAGMSAQSGVPTYRGAGGIWKSYDYQSYACQEAFDADPARVWDFHNYRRGVVGACAPHGGHLAIARLQGRRSGVRVVTQNIDGLHQQAGSQDVLEVHGSLWRVRCDRCRTARVGRESPLTDLRCPGCGGWWRPAITWFGDRLDEAVLDAAIDAVTRCDLLVAVGTSGVVYPAAALPFEAKRAGAEVWEINPEPTELSAVADRVFREAAADALGAWID